MDLRLLEHYEKELGYLRDMGAEFARQFPKVAARLGMDGIEVADPYVERLLEGVAFLTARVQLKLDAEFPRFTQALLELVYPHYLAPTPAMLMARIAPDARDPNLPSGVTIPRGSTLHGMAGAGVPTACQFRTAHDVRLFPVEVVSASYFSFAPDLPLNAVRTTQPIKGGLRIRLKTAAGVKFHQTAIETLPFFLTGQEDVANRLYELCLGAGLGVLALPPGAAAGSYQFLPPDTIRPAGFSDAEALLTARADTEGRSRGAGTPDAGGALPLATQRSFQGYRLLHEYFSFPERYRFVELTGLAPVRAATESDELEVVLLFSRGDATLERDVGVSNLALFCTPAINLFSRRADRIHVNEAEHEYHVVVDRTRQHDFEIHEVMRVTGHGAGSGGERVFLPFYAAYSGDGPPARSAYFTIRRTPRVVSETEKRRGSRSKYTGSEVFLSIVDAAHAPFSRDLRQLAIEVSCTNRDLPLHMPLGTGKTDLTLDVAAPIETIRVIAGPSRPWGPLADGAVAWRAINHLSIGYQSLVDASPREGAVALRQLLSLYAAAVDAAGGRGSGVVASKQVEGIRSVAVERVVRRLPPPAGPEPARASDRRLAFGRGIAIALDVDELAFEGGSAFLFGAVLARYFARHASINTFTETVLRAQGRGESHRWGPQWGVRPTL